MRKFTCFDAHSRKSYPTILGFAGLESVSGIGLSVSNVRESIFSEYPLLLSKAVETEGFLQLGAFIPFFTALVFLLVPMQLTVWLAIIGISTGLICHLIAVGAIFNLSQVIFLFLIGVAFVPFFVADVRTWEWFWTKSKYDKYVLLLVKFTHLLLTAVLIYQFWSA